MKPNPRIASLLVAVLCSACAGISSTTTAEFHPPFSDPITITVEVDQQGEDTVDVQTPLDLQGQCMNFTWIDENGNTQTTSVEITGPQTMSPVPPGSVFVLSSVSECGGGGERPGSTVAVGGRYVRTTGRKERGSDTYSFALCPLQIIPGGFVNRSMAIIVTANSYAQAEQRVLEWLPQAAIGAPMPSWMIRYQMSELTQLGSGDWELEVGSKGGAFQSFYMYVNPDLLDPDLQPYAELGSGNLAVSTFGEWVLARTVIDLEDLNVGTVPGITYENDICFSYETDFSAAAGEGETLEDYSFSYAL